jgi:hypothetical protein
MSNPGAAKYASYFFLALTVLLIEIVPITATADSTMTQKMDKTKREPNQKSISFWGFSGEEWDKYLIWSVMGAAIAALAVGVATVGSINAHKREAEAAERELAEYKVTTDGRIASADAAGEHAKEAAAAANKEAAIAQERAVRLEKKAAEARLQTAQIMKSTAWRQLLPSQERILVKILSSKPGKVVLEWPGNDPEAVALAIQFTNILHEAKWEFTYMAQSFPTAVVWGIVVPDKSAPETVTLRDALTGAGIPFITGAMPEANGMAFGNAGAIGKDTAVLLIGSRRPNLAQSPN